VARSSLGRQAITWERSSEVASLVPATGPGDGGLPDAARRLLAEWEHIAPETIISIGVGRPSDDPIRLSESYGEARRALHVSAWRTGGGAVSEFRHLGVDRLLVGLPDAELADFVATMLQPLVDYDRRHRADLVVTLEAWLETRNAAAAARRLFVHYNTMKNRLRLIEDILGGSLDDPHRSLALSVALRIHGLPRA
jgi:purine catabolism regulator